MNALAMSTAGAAVAGSSAVKACSFQLDVQWILDIIDKVSDFLRRIGEAANTVFDIIGEVLATLSTIADFFAWVPGLGKMGKDAIKNACDLAGDAAEKVFSIEADVLQFCKNALAPWEIRSAGQQINEQIVPGAQQFSGELDAGRFASNASWKGLAAEKFRGKAREQAQFANTLTEGTESFGKVVQEMGEAGVKATMDFVQNFVAAAIALVEAIIKVCAVPVGTAVAAADVIKLVTSILAMVKVWVEAIMAIVKQTAAITQAADAAAPTNAWPAMAR